MPISINVMTETKTLLFIHILLTPDADIIYRDALVATFSHIEDNELQQTVLAYYALRDSQETSSQSMDLNVWHQVTSKAPSASLSLLLCILCVFGKMTCILIKTYGQFKAVFPLDFGWS